MIKSIFLFYFLLSFIVAFSQGVSINNTGATPNSNSILDVSSDDKGVFFPRLTTIARTTLGNSLVNTDNGMFVYDKDLLIFFYWDGIQWVQVGSGAGSDDQNLTGATLTGTSLQIQIEDGNSTTVDLSTLQDGVNDADSNPNNEIELPIGGTPGQILSTNGTGVYSWIDDENGTDNQNINGSGLSGTILSIGIENGSNETVDLQSIIPTGLVGAFNLNTCPSGWIKADGQNGTPDLRGEFVRGLDDGRGIDIGRALGSWQDEEIQSHSHTVDPPSATTISSGLHSHSIDPPSTTTSVNGSHRHFTPTIRRAFYDQTGGAGGYGQDTSLGPGPNVYTNTTGDHTHTLNIAAFNSSSEGSHSHTFNIVQFDSGNSGGAETRPRNVALLYCIKQ